MKKAALHSIFWILLAIAFSFLISYLFMSVNLRNIAVIGRDVRERVDKYKIPTFEIRDVSYSEAGSVATLEFNLINMGDDIVLSGWLLEFLTPDGKEICRATIFTGDPTEAGRIFTEIYIPERNVTLSEAGQAIWSGEVAEVTITLLQTCLNETINYSRTGEKMVVKLTIPPTGSSAILKCSVDPNTGFATCSE